MLEKVDAIGKENTSQVAKVNVKTEEVNVKLRGKC